MQCSQFPCQSDARADHDLCTECLESYLSVIAECHAAVYLDIITDKRAANDLPPMSVADIAAIHLVELRIEAGLAGEPSNQIQEAQ